MRHQFFWEGQGRSGGCDRSRAAGTAMATASAAATAAAIRGANDLNYGLITAKQVGHFHLNVDGPFVGAILPRMSCGS